MVRDPSRWWYALVPFPVLVGLRYALVWLTTLLLPTAGPGRAGALPALLLGVGASLGGALAVVTAPLFVAGVVLDVRALRTRSSWTPHWGYGALGVLPALGLVVEWLALLSIPAAIGYLVVRRRRIGYPLGGEPSADTDAGTETETTTAAIQSPADPSPSRWLYGVVVPPVLELTGGILVWTVRTAGVLRQGGDPLALLVPVAVVLVAIGLVPLFAASLYLDARAVRDASGETTLHPRIWGVLGLGSVVGLVLVRVTFMPVIALAYVLRRRRATGS